ncbi:unnamed protein product, partial [Brenthis ino]
MIRDRIFIGVKEQRIQQKLLEVKDLTMAKAVDICRSAELSREQSDNHAWLATRDADEMLPTDICTFKRYR